MHCDKFSCSFQYLKLDFYQKILGLFSLSSEEVCLFGTWKSWITVKGMDQLEQNPKGLHFRVVGPLLWWARVKKNLFGIGVSLAILLGLGDWRLISFFVFAGWVGRIGCAAILLSFKSCFFTMKKYFYIMIKIQGYTILQRHITLFQKCSLNWKTNSLFLPLLYIGFLMASST